MFYRDNLIANSGTSGDWVDLAFIPTVFGSNVTERLMKFDAYKKQGKAVIDSSQDGIPMNTTFGGYDNTVKFEAIQAIDLAMQRVEEACSTITGVFREKLGGIEQRDAVSNVQVGLRQSTYITKQIFYMMDLVTREMLLDMLNTCKVVFKKGITGTIVLGDRLNQIFTALPQHFTLTDYDINIQDSSKIIQDFELIKQLASEFTKSGNTDPEIILEIITSNSLTKMKEDVIKALTKKKQENDMIGKMQQEIENLNNQLQQFTKDNQTLERKVTSLNEAALQLDREKLEYEKELEWYKARVQANFNDKKLDNDNKRIEAEILQLYDNNPKNDEIKNN